MHVWYVPQLLTRVLASIAKPCTLTKSSRADWINKAHDSRFECICFGTAKRNVPSSLLSISIRDSMCRKCSILEKCQKKSFLSLVQRARQIFAYSKQRLLSKKKPTMEIFKYLLTIAVPSSLGAGERIDMVSGKYYSRILWNHLLLSILQYMKTKQFYGQKNFIKIMLNF